MRIEGISNTSISIITPELVYEGSSSLVNLILLSHETICDIKDAVGDSTAVIFCGKPTENDYILSSILEFPVYGVPWDRLPAIQSVEFIGDVQTLINEKELDADYPGRNTKSDIYFNYFVDFNGKIVDLGTVEYIDSIDLDIIPAQTFPIINVSEIICKLASKFHEYSGVGYLTIKVAKTKSSITLMEVMPYFNEKIVKLLHFRTSSNTYRDENGAFLFDVRKAQIPEFSFLSLVREIDLDSARKVNQPKQMENRVMLWINNCSHSNMTYFPLNVFQTMARSAQIDFEEQYRTGTLFVTSKQLYTANRQVALYVIGKSFLDALQATRTNMKALHDLMHIDGMKVSSNIKVRSLKLFIISWK